MRAGHEVKVIKKVQPHVIDDYVEELGKRGICHACGKSFILGAGLANHQRNCGSRAGFGIAACIDDDEASADHEEPPDEELEEAEVHTPLDVGGDHINAAQQGAPDTAATQQEQTSTTEVRGPKLKKDGKPKVSGLREGEKRGQARTLYFKYECVRHLCATCNSKHRKVGVPIRTRRLPSIMEYTKASFQNGRSKKISCAKLCYIVMSLAGEASERMRS